MKSLCGTYKCHQTGAFEHQNRLYCPRCYGYLTRVNEGDLFTGCLHSITAVAVVGLVIIVAAVCCG